MDSVNDRQNSLHAKAVLAQHVRAPGWRVLLPKQKRSAATSVLRLRLILKSTRCIQSVNFLAYVIATLAGLGRPRTGWRQLAIEQRPRKPHVGGALRVWERARRGLAGSAYSARRMAGPTTDRRGSLVGMDRRRSLVSASP